MHARRNVFIALLISALLLAFAPPAAAETLTLDDATGDVVDQDGTPVTDPQLDVLGVTFSNELDGVEIDVEVAQGVPFDQWDDLLVGVALEPPSGGSYYSAIILPVEGQEPFAFLMRGKDVDDTDQTFACAGSATLDGNVYSVTFDSLCARSLPRELGVGAVAFRIISDTSYSYDQAPEGDGLSDAIAASAAAATKRVAGTDRILTAIALSKDLYGAGDAGAVVLASSANFPDALAGGPLAYVLDAPMLLTGPTGLDGRVLTEIRRVLPAGGTVYVLGGTAALAPKVESDLTAAGFDALRVAGNDRFETAIAIAGQIDGIANGHSTVLIADGVTFTDALIAGAAAPAVEGVVVLTFGSTLPQSTNSYLVEDTSDHIAIGTPASEAVPGTQRIIAGGPSALSVRVADQLVPGDGTVAVASSAGFPDSLAGGPHIAALHGPLLLTTPSSLPESVRVAIAQRAADLRDVLIYGGTAAVSTSVEQAIRSALSS